MRRDPDRSPTTWGTPALSPRSAGSLYEFIRAYLREHGGSSTRSELLAAVKADSAAAAKLQRSRGFTALLSNMKHSGFIEVHGELITATGRRLGRRRR